MKSLVLTALIFCLSMPAWAGHSQGNGTCDDDILHWSNMVNKRTDAPLHAKSLKMAELAQRSPSVWQCENFMEEALRTIRKPYPTE